jgi:hypothetical protein
VEAYHVTIIASFEHERHRRKRVDRVERIERLERKIDLVGEAVTADGPKWDAPS